MGVELQNAAQSAFGGYLAERIRWWTTLGCLSWSCYRHPADLLEYLLRERGALFPEYVQIFMVINKI
jgi:hypothetical protein